jgi:predicted DNA-binding protein
MEMSKPIIVKAVPVILPIEHWAALKQQSQRTGRSRSAIIRALVACHLSADRPRSSRTT